MKRINYLIKFFLLFFVVTVISCKSDDDTGSGNENKKSIIGKWAIKSTIVEGEEEEYKHQIGCEKDYYEFTEDLLFKFIRYEKNCEISDDEIIADYIVNDTMIETYSSEGGQIISEGTYYIENDILKLVFETPNGDITGIFTRI